MEAPLISICIPVYNCEKYLERTISCILKQSYSNIELILVDDGSTDTSLQIMSEIMDDRISVISTANFGASNARNLSYRQAMGKYIIFFDADDYIQPDFIERQYQRINHREDVVVLSGWGRFYENDLSTFKPEAELLEQEMNFEEWILKFWKRCNPMTNPGRALIPDSILKSSGLWNTGLSLNDDFEFFTRVFLSVKKIVFNDKAQLYYNSGLTGLSSMKDQKALLSLFQSIKLSTEMVAKNSKDEAILRCCANIWQWFVYIAYPKEAELIRNATREIKRFGGSDFQFPAGGISKFLTRAVGWKMTKRIKNFIS